MNLLIASPFTNQREVILWDWNLEVNSGDVCQDTIVSMHYLLFYEVGEDFVSSRAEFGDEHLMEGK